MLAVLLAYGLLMGAGVNKLAGEQVAATGKREGQQKEKATTEVQAQMRNVKYRFAEDAWAHIAWMDGSLSPTEGSEFPVLDEKKSFEIKVDAGKMSIRAEELGRVLNKYVFAGADAPMTGLSVTIENQRLKVKGRLRKGGIPFEMTGNVTATADGKILLKSEEIKALHLPVKGLMNLFGVDLSDLIKSGKVPGVEAGEDSLVLDLAKILPPPHLRGKITAIHAKGDGLLVIFGEPGRKAEKNMATGNYMAFRESRLRFGKLTMNDSDLVILDMENKDPLDFYLDHYREQLAAGYVKITPGFQLRVYMKDFGKLRGTRSGKGGERAGAGR